MNYFIIYLHYGPFHFVACSCKLCPGSTCNATVVSRRYKRFTTAVETLTTVALLVEPDYYDGCVAQL